MSCYTKKICCHTSVMLSNILPIVSLRLSFAFSIASNLTRTASILETMLPIECSILSTLRDKTVNSSYDTPFDPLPDLVDLDPFSSISELSSPLSSFSLILLLALRAVPGLFPVFSSSSYSLLRAAYWIGN